MKGQGGSLLLPDQIGQYPLFRGLAAREDSLSVTPQPGRCPATPPLLSRDGARLISSASPQPGRCPTPKSLTPRYSSCQLLFVRHQKHWPLGRTFGALTSPGMDTNNCLSGAVSSSWGYCPWILSLTLSNSARRLQSQPAVSQSHPEVIQNRGLQGRVLQSPILYCMLSFANLQLCAETKIEGRRCCPPQRAFNETRYHGERIVCEFRVV